MQQNTTVYKTYTGSVTNMLGHFCENLGHLQPKGAKGKQKRKHVARTIRVDVYEYLEINWLLSSNTIAAMMHNEMYNKKADVNFLKQVLEGTAAEYWRMLDPKSQFRPSAKVDEYLAYEAVCESQRECKPCYFRGRVRTYLEREIFWVQKISNMVQSCNDKYTEDLFNWRWFGEDVSTAESHTNESNAEALRMTQEADSNMASLLPALVMYPLEDEIPYDMYPDIPRDVMDSRAKLFAEQRAENLQLRMYWWIDRRSMLRRGPKRVIGPDGNIIGMAFSYQPGSYYCEAVRGASGETLYRGAQRPGSWYDSLE